MTSLASRIILILQTLLITALLPVGLQAAPAPQKEATVEGITSWRLANGLQVLLAPDQTKPTVTVNITYLVGSRHEGKGETGMAHLLEHMLFKGTPTVPNLPQEFTKRAMQPNGTTSYDRTNYFETFAANDMYLQWAIQMEADRMIHANVARKDLDSEMTVVRNEMESGENSPSRILFQKVMASAYEWHSYGRNVMGSRSDVENVGIDNLRAFYTQYYQPDNAVLIIAGKIDAAKTLAWVNQYFGVIPKPTRILPKEWTIEPVQEGAHSLRLERTGGTPLLDVLYHTVPGAHPDAVALDALTHVLVGTPNGRLYKSLVSTGKIVSIGGWHQDMHDPGFIAFRAELNKDDTGLNSQKAILDGLESVAQQPVTEAELQLAKNAAASFYEQISRNPQQLAMALTDTVAQGDWRLYFLQRDRYEQLTTADVNAVAAKYLKPTNRSLGLYLPQATKPDLAPAASAIDVAAMTRGYQGKTATAEGEAFEPTPANLDGRTTRFTLANGLQLALLPKKTRGNTVQIRLTLQLGNGASLTNKSTLSELTAAMLNRGSAHKNRETLAAEQDRLRSHIGISGGGQEVYVSAETTREHVTEVVDLIREMLQEPAFDPAELDTLKRQVISKLHASKNQPQAEAALALGRLNNHYPAGDLRYTPTREEEIAAIEAIDDKAIRQFHQQFYGSSHAQVALVGDFDPELVRKQIETQLGRWNSPVPYVRLPDPFWSAPAQHLEVNTPDKQNAVFLARLGIPVTDSDPDYPALMLVNHLLGGGFLNSRLSTRLRQQEGISYSAVTQLNIRTDDANSSLIFFAILAPQNRARLEAAVQDVIKTALDKGFSETEVAEARASLLQERQLSRTQDGNIASTLATQLRLGRTFALSQAVDNRLAKISAVEVNDVLRRYLQPAAMQEVFAGDLQKTKQ